MGRDTSMSQGCSELHPSTLPGMGQFWLLVKPGFFEWWSWRDGCKGDVGLLRWRKRTARGSMWSHRKGKGISSWIHGPGLNELHLLLAKLPNYQVSFSCSLTLDFKNLIRMQYKIKEPLKTARLYLILSYHQALSAWQEKRWHFLISPLSYLSWLEVSSPQLIEVTANSLH